MRKISSGENLKFTQFSSTNKVSRTKQDETIFKDAKSKFEEVLNQLPSSGSYFSVEPEHKKKLCSELAVKMGAVEKLLGELNVRFMYWQTSAYLLPISHFYQVWPQTWRVHQIQFCRTSLAQLLTDYGLFHLSVECFKQISELNSKMRKMLTEFSNDFLRGAQKESQCLVSHSSLFISPPPPLPLPSPPTFNLLSPFPQRKKEKNSGGAVMGAENEKRKKSSKKKGEEIGVGGAGKVELDSHSWCVNEVTPSNLLEKVKEVCEQVRENRNIPKTGQLIEVEEQLNLIVGTESAFYQKMTSYWNEVSSRLTEEDKGGIQERGLGREEKRGRVGGEENSISPPSSPHFSHFHNYLHQTRQLFLQEASSPLSTRFSLQNASFRFSYLFQKMFSFCEKFVGSAPCEYGVVLLGSAAREEMCPFSDLEFAILLPKLEMEKEKVERVRQYFMTLLHLLEIQFILLGESEPNPNGLSLDSGRNHPLAQPDTFLGSAEALLKTLSDISQITGYFSFHFTSFHLISFHFT